MKEGVISPMNQSWFSRFVSTIRGMFLLKLSTWINPKSISMIVGLIIFLGIIGIMISSGASGGNLINWLEEPISRELLPLVCLAIAGGVIRTEIKEGTIEYLWTRPAGKAQVVLGGYLCSVVGVCVIVYALDLSLFTIGLFRGIDYSFGDLMSLMYAQSLGIVAYCGISIAVASFFEKYMVMGVLYFLLIEAGIGSIPTNLSFGSVSRHLATLIAGEDRLGASLGCLSITGISIVLALFVYQTKIYGIGKKAD